MLLFIIKSLTMTFSTGLDRYLRFWDTESRQLLSAVCYQFGLKCFFLKYFFMLYSGVRLYKEFVLFPHYEALYIAHLIIIFDRLSKWILTAVRKTCVLSVSTATMKKMLQMAVKVLVIIWLCSIFVDHFRMFQYPSRWFWWLFWCRSSLSSILQAWFLIHNLMMKVSFCISTI